MKRMLCIVSAMNTGGAETFMMKLYRALDKSKYQIDFCVSSKEKGFYDDEILSLGGKIFYVPPKSKKPLQNFMEIKKLVKKEKYKYVMRIGQNSLVVFDLLFAKLGGAKKLILRSSNSNTCGGRISGVLHKLFRFMPKLIPNVKIAPSTEAANFVFGKNAVKNNKVIILNNAIPVENFTFKIEQRRDCRQELRLNDEFVVGHIGRLTYQKNHDFLFKVFSEIKKKVPNAVLLLIGDGELKEELVAKSKSLGLEDSIRFLGIRSDIPKLLMSMDVMVFPSFYEGMPNTVIEAQASGLHCIISDSITREANITGLVEYMSLQDTPESWSNKAISHQGAYERISYEKKFEEAGYDIKKVADYFANLVFD